MAEIEYVPYEDNKIKEDNKTIRDNFQQVPLEIEEKKVSQLDSKPENEKNPEKVSKCCTCLKSKRRMSREKKKSIKPVSAQTDQSNPNVELPPIISTKKDDVPPETPSKCRICLYRCSIEKWQPLRGEIYCPNCQKSETPLLRTKSKKTKSKYSNLFTNCILHCWPLCFITSLFPPSSQHYLHCNECFNFLGEYDGRKKCLRPNRDYVDYDGCYSVEETKRRKIIKKQEEWKEPLFTCKTA